MASQECRAQALLDYEQGGCSVLFQLEVGDVVNVRAETYDGTLYAPGNGFVGYLIQTP